MVTNSALKPELGAIFPLGRAGKATPDRLLDVWRTIDIEFYSMDRQFPVHRPWFPGVIRGAWGKSLQALSKEGWYQARIALSACFGEHKRPDVNRSLPKPFVIQTERADKGIVVRLRLFGFASAFQEAAQIALSRSLRQGITGNGVTRERESMTIDKEIVRYCEGYDGTQPTNTARMSFYTPYRIGGSALSTRCEDLVFAMAERVAGLSHWQGFTTDIDFGEVRRATKTMMFDDKGLRHEAWERRSSRQNGRIIPMVGLSGEIILQNVESWLAPLLTLGSVSHIGSAAALGLGRYVISSKS